MGNIKNSKGFTLVETLLALLIIAVIGFGSYYVYQNQHKDNSKTASTNVPEATKTKTQSKIQSTDVFQGWRSYTLPYEKLSFKYPTDWTIANEDRTNFNDTVTIKAPSGFIVYINTGVQEGIGTPAIADEDSWPTTFNRSPASLIFIYGGSHLSPNESKIGGAMLVRKDANRSGHEDKNVIGCSGCNGVNGPEGSFLQVAFGGKEVELNAAKMDKDYVQGKHIVESMHY